MTQSTQIPSDQHRAAMAGIGAIGALALWALAEGRAHFAAAPALYLAVFIFVACYFGVTLVLAGPVSMSRAFNGALYLALPVTALVSLAGQRYEVAVDLMDDPLVWTVVWVLVHVATPFLLVRLESPKNWRNYEALFDAAWIMTMRFALAIVFLGIFWLVVFLSNALLGLVGVEIIDWLLKTDWAPFVLSGGMLGLGLAVVYELRSTLSPYLILRLLRLLVPVVLAVLTVFLLAVPFRGLSGLFGDVSSAFILMATAIVAFTLISSALDRDDTKAIRTKGMRGATRILILLLPLLGALAVWAVVLRVNQYGWTPERLLAATISGFVLAYAVGYALAALRGAGWPARVRQVNVWLAMSVVVVCGLWLTPVIDPFR